jgi:hypothetical protein
MLNVRPLKYRTYVSRNYCEAIPNPDSVSPKVKELRKAANRFLLKVHPGKLSSILEKNWNFNY